jgi:hypothetical protein
VVVVHPLRRSFHGRLRDECLNASWFRTLNDVRCTLATWREEYNCERPIARSTTAHPWNSNLPSKEAGHGPAFFDNHNKQHN